MAKFPEREEFVGHPTQETRRANSPDVRLRLHGFSIHARPKQGPAVWRRGSALYVQSAALAVCREECK